MNTVYHTLDNIQLGAIKLCIVMNSPNCDVHGKIVTTKSDVEMSDDQISDGFSFVDLNQFT